MLGKNRIRRIEGLQRCCRLSVLDLHGNRITQISGLDNLAELKVLNMAGNQIRKICNMQGLQVLEELNIRRNRIRSTVGLEVVPTLEKLFISNNELQVQWYMHEIGSIVKDVCITKSCILLSRHSNEIFLGDMIVIIQHKLHWTALCVVMKKNS